MQADEEAEGADSGDALRDRPPPDQEPVEVDAVDLSLPELEVVDDEE